MLFKDRFGYTNHGKVGILRFFRAHECNDYCKQLKLLNLESLNDPSKLKAVKTKYKEQKEVAHLYEELDKKIKESQRQIRQFDPTIEIELEPIDEDNEND